MNKSFWWMTKSRYLLYYGLYGVFQGFYYGSVLRRVI